MLSAVLGREQGDGNRQDIPPNVGLGDGGSKNIPPNGGLGGYFHGIRLQHHVFTLKASSDGSTITFNYSTVTTPDTVVGTAPINILSARAGGITGITVGIYEE